MITLKASKLKQWLQGHRNTTNLIPIINKLLLLTFANGDGDKVRPWVTAWTSPSLLARSLREGIDSS